VGVPGGSRTVTSGLTESHTVACFVRVDIKLDTEPSPGAYDAISERLQNLVQEALLEPADRGAQILLLGMTCLVLGPVPVVEAIHAKYEHKNNFAPVAEWLHSPPLSDG